MRLDVVEIGRICLRGIERGPQKHLLSRGVRRGEAGAAAVVIGGAAPDDGPDAVTVRHRVAVPLEHDHAAALTSHDAVGFGVEGTAHTGRRQSIDLAHEYTEFGCEHEVDAAGQGRVAFAAAQGLAGQMNRHQRRGAGRVEHDARAVQAEGVGDAAGAEAELLAARVVGADLPGPGRLGVQQGIVHAQHAGEDPGPAAFPGVPRCSAVLHGRPGGLQQQALLRIQLTRFPGRDTEEAGVEPVYIVEEGAPRAVGRSRMPRVAVEEPRAPAIRRDLPGDIQPLEQYPPETVQIAHPAGEAAPDPGDSDVACLRRLTGPRLLPASMRIVRHDWPSCTDAVSRSLHRLMTSSFDELYLC